MTVRPKLARATAPLHHRACAFTLIEVLVVVAIIALLISILLPSLSAARDEARKVVCTTNLHQIGIASASYLDANRNRYPWGPGKTDVFSHYFAGETDKGDGPGSRWSSWYGPGTTRHTPASERPLNKYLIGRSLGKRSDAKLPVFRCPTDNGVRSRGNFDEPSSTNPCYYVLGTSYEANIIWQLYVQQKENLTGEAYSKRIEYLKNRLIFIFEKKGASRAVLAFEDPADCTLGGVLYNWHPDLRYIGWHRRPNFYSSLFLDGHAENLYMAHKKVLDYSYTGVGGSINPTCNPASGNCLNGDARWIVRQDWKEQ